jgi:hypothetical protein
MKRTEPQGSDAWRPAFFRQNERFWSIGRAGESSTKVEKVQLDTQGKPQLTGGLPALALQDGVLKVGPGMITAYRSNLAARCPTMAPEAGDL